MNIVVLKICAWGAIFSVAVDLITAPITIRELESLGKNKAGSWANMLAGYTITIILAGYALGWW